MTRNEEAEMRELGMTPEQLKQRQAQVSAIINGEAQPAKPARKPRSDKGVPKAKKPEAAPGMLTQEQVARVRYLIGIAQTKAFAVLREIAERERAIYLAEQELYAYLDSLTSQK